MGETNISEITFKVKRIRYRNEVNRYTIISGIIYKESLGLKISKEITIKGVFPVIFENDEFSAKAIYLLDKNYGYFFELRSIPTIILPENEKTLFKFVKSRVYRVGDKKVKDIIEKFKLDTLDIINNEYERLTEVEGIDLKKAKNIHDSLVSYDNFYKLFLFIQSMGIESKVALYAYDKYGDMSISRIKSNPYCICDDNDRDVSYFKYAEKMAFNLKKPSTSIKRVKAGIMQYINYRATSYGDLCIYEEMIYQNLNDYLRKFGVYEDSVIEDNIITHAIEELKNEMKIVIEENVMGEKFIYHRFLNLIENKIVKDLNNLITNSILPFCSEKEIYNFIKNYEDNYFHLDIMQKKAVYMALLNRISILTGSPGTGKTQTTNTIVQCIRKIKPSAEILLLAPTGKASNRMKELTNMDASTIHRGLNIRYTSFNDDVDSLSADFVVVDESSMIDAYIFHELLKRIGDNTRVLFVGDINQLPSVGAGLILRDMIDSGMIPTTELNKIFRQAENSDIVKNAHKIINGKITTDENGIDISNRNGSNFIFWKGDTTDNIKNKIIKSIDRLTTKYGYNKEDIAILTPMKMGDIGTLELNRMLQEKLNPPSKKKAELNLDGIDKLRVGDKVMQTVNNYDFEVFNGDIGVITKIYNEILGGIKVKMVDVAYSDKTVTYDESQLEEIELAFSMTIHKSQGSEFKAVIIPLHLSQTQLLNRNLIYTGITRAKEMVIIVGDTNALDYAITHVDPCNRISRLKEKIMNIKKEKKAV